MKTKNEQRVMKNDALTERMPFFSIIVPVYNVAPYLRECLDSVLAQTYPNWECLCVNDGSTDDSGAILDEYAQKDSRFRVFHKKNGGVSAARNLALDNACGEWIWFVDGDDAIRSDALAWLNQVAMCYPCIFSISFNANYGTELKTVTWQKLPSMESLRLYENVTSEVLKAHRRAGWSTVLRKNSIKFEPYVIGEDVLYQMTAFWLDCRNVITDECLYFYREREGSAVQGKVSSRKVKDFLETEIKLAQLFIANRDKWNRRDCLEYFQWNRNFVWFTFRFMLNQLSRKEMRPLLPLWCQVQELQFSLLPETFKRRIICWMIQKTNSSFLCQVIVFWKANLKRLLCLLGLLDIAIQLRKVVSNHDKSC